MRLAGGGVHVEVFETGDSFEKFILDGARDLVGSKPSIKVHRPYIGDVVMQGSTPRFKDVRDLTVIAVVEKK